MKAFFETEIKKLIQALKEAGYRRDRRRAGSFRKGKFHILLTPTPNKSGYIMDIHKDTKTIKIDKTHIRHRGKYRGKDLEKEMTRIKAVVHKY